MANELAALENEVTETGKALKQAEAMLGEARESRAHAVATLDTLKEQMGGMRASVKEHFDLEPEGLAEHLTVKTEAQDIESTRAQKEKLSRERDNIGPVNLRADDEAASVVLLTGVMLAAFAAALLALLLALAPDGTLRPMVFWLLGDLAGATDLRLALAACVALALALAAALKLARPLNLLLRGDVQALTQGVPVERVRRALVLVAALATGIAVALAGAVGFVGFVAPHLLRLVVGNDQRVLLPASVLGGGTLVVLADTLARTVAAPLQLPVGVVTALIGVPVFLWLLPRR